MLTQLCGQFVQARQIQALGEQREFVQWKVLLGQDTALLGLQGVPLGVLPGLLEEWPHQPLGQSAAPRAAEATAEESDLAIAVREAVSASARSVSSRSAGRTMFTTIRPTGSFAARSSAIPSAVSCTGISSSSVTKWTAVSGDLRTRMTAWA